MSAASSGVALGRIPGSLKLVWSRVITTKTKRAPPMTGMQPVRCFTRNGQLWHGADTDRGYILIPLFEISLICAWTTSCSGSSWTPSHSSYFCSVNFTISALNDIINSSSSLTVYMQDNSLLGSELDRQVACQSKWSNAPKTDPALSCYSKPNHDFQKSSLFSIVWNFKLATWTINSSEPAYCDSMNQ